MIESHTLKEGETSTDEKSIIVSISCKFDFLSKLKNWHEVLKSTIKKRKKNLNFM